ncbi:MAG: hypothetical protein JSW41_03945 [Candidatus Aenigmatarchaeota archaeon]|nr:MAG: hypothetical protein JSW41_03945 [Candidatus Aenigmarchaeota archaeon]
MYKLIRIVPEIMESLESKLRNHCDRCDVDRWWLDDDYRKKFINETKNIIMGHKAKEVKYERPEEDTGDT